MNTTFQLDEKARLCKELESKYGCHNYSQIDVVLAKGEGIFVWDTAGKKYYDFLAGHATVSQGHSNKKIIEAIIEQANKISLPTRIFYSDNLGFYSKKLCETFGYDKVLLMNTGVEAGEAALKIAKRWGYYIKKIEKDKAKLVFMKGNYWGRTYLACATSDDKSRSEGFGPYPDDFYKLIEYNNPQALESYLKSEPNVCCVMLEPIQGEKGTIIPDSGYLTKVREICTKYNVLMCCDEIQTGLGRTGAMLASDHENVRPDIILLGKALSGGMYPISAVLCDNEIMMTMTPGSHGSTFGGNSLACAIGIAALDELLDQNMIENCKEMGELMLDKMKELYKFDFIKQVRGKGLLCAIEFYPKDHEKHIDPVEFCNQLRNFGMLAKPAHGCIIRYFSQQIIFYYRLSPPLIIKRQELLEAMTILHQVATTFK